MTTTTFYHLICYGMYRQLNSEEKEFCELDYSTEELEQYIQKQLHNPNYYFCAGLVAARILLENSKIIGEYNRALGAVSMFEDLIGVNKDEKYDRDVLREYFSDMSKSKLVELCIKLTLGDQKTLDEMLEEDWDK